MAAAERTFKFLTNEEFNRLSQKDKLDYLASAVSMLNESTNSLKIFRDARTRPKLKPKPKRE